MRTTPLTVREKFAIAATLAFFAALFIGALIILKIPAGLFNGFHGG